MTYPSSGQPWNGQPDQQQPQYGGYGGTPTPPLSGPPYSGYETGGYPQESYTTEPPMSGQPYDPNYGAQQPGYQQGYPGGGAQQPGYQGYAPPQQAPSFVTPPAPRGNRGGMLALVIGGIVVLLLLVGIGTAVVLTSGDDDDPKANPTASASASAEPSESAEPGEYPARIDLPQTVAGLTKVDNAALNQTANQTAQQIKTATNADSAVAAYYAPSGDLTKAVGLVGATGRITDPEGELDDAFSGELAVSGAEDVDPGPLGGEMRCGTTASNGQALTVCGWADGGSLMLGIFINRSSTDSADLFRQIGRSQREMRAPADCMAAVASFTRALELKPNNTTFLGDRAGAYDCLDKDFLVQRAADRQAIVDILEASSPTKTATAGAAFNFRVSVERGASGEGGYIEAVSGAFE